MGALSPLLLVSLDRQRPFGTARELIGAGLRTVRRLPDRASQLPVLGVQTALSVADTVRREYRSAREEGWTAALRRLGPERGRAAGTRESALGWPEEPADGARQSREVAAAARQAGAPGAATEAVEQAEADLAAAVPDGADLQPDTLPLPDYDQLTVGSLRARMRRLSAPELLTLREYEKAHANRLQVVTMLENRIAKLETSGEAEADSEADSDSDSED